MIQRINREELGGKRLNKVATATAIQGAIRGRYSAYWLTHAAVNLEALVPIRLAAGAVERYRGWTAVFVGNVSYPLIRAPVDAEQPSRVGCVGIRRPYRFYGPPL